MMTHYIFHFRIWNNSETKERLKSNLSHILGSRKDILIKVFSKLARSLRGKTEKVSGRMAPCPWASVFFLLKKSHSALESKKASIRTSIFLLPETSNFQSWDASLCSWEEEPDFSGKVNFPKNQFLIYFILLSDQVPNSLSQKALPQNDILHLDSSNLADISL